MSSSEVSEEKGSSAYESGGGAKDDRNSIALILRNADKQDVILMALGTFGAIGDGISTNCFLIFVIDLFNSLGYGKKPQDHHGYFMPEIEKVTHI